MLAFTVRYYFTPCKQTHLCERLRIVRGQTACFYVKVNRILKEKCALRLRSTKSLLWQLCHQKDVSFVAQIVINNTFSRPCPKQRISEAEFFLRSVN